MSAIKLTKTELRDQQHKLSQLEKYLPTLQLKKAMLQLEITQAAAELEAFKRDFEDISDQLGKMSHLFSQFRFKEFSEIVKLDQVHKAIENIAGVEVPRLVDVTFKIEDYFLFDTPAWFDFAIDRVVDLIKKREHIKVAEERKRALEKELREVSIRVNLFEKVMIPRCKANIKKIKIFLGDLQLSDVSRAKVSKKKIIERHKKSQEDNL